MERVARTMDATDWAIAWQQELRTAALHVEAVSL